MSSPGQGALPLLGVADFGPGQFHVAQAFVQDKVFAILRADDPALAVFPLLLFPVDDLQLYVFVHGGEDVARYQNLGVNPTHEIPPAVLARRLVNYYGNLIVGTPLRVCACYGNLLRTGERATANQLLASELPFALLEGYSGLIIVQTTPPILRLGQTVVWDPQIGAAVVVGSPGTWERVTP